MQLGICCSPLQRQMAVRLGERLTRNLGVKIVIVADEAAPLMESWQQASASDAVLLMLDRTSAPGPVKRSDWQSLLDHHGEPPVATLKLEHCAYPKLLERSRFFAPSEGNELEAGRWVERWLVSLVTFSKAGLESQGILRVESADGGNCPVAEWWTTIVDGPGMLRLSPNKIDAVQTFAYEAAAHFHNVVWLGFEGLPAEAETAMIESHCAAAVNQNARLLFVLVHATPGLAPPVTERHSFVILEGGPTGSLVDSFAVDRLAGVPLTAFVGACRWSGFPAVVLDLMAGWGSRQEWASVVVPLTSDGRWFRPRGDFKTSAEACERHFGTLREVFRFWRRQPELCRELVGEAAWAIERNRGVGIGPGELGLDLALFLLEEKRMVEAVVWLRMVASAGDEGDEFGIRAREELRWHVDEFGLYRRPEPILPGNQVGFDFPGFFVAQEMLGVVDHYALLKELEAEAAAQRMLQRGAEGRPAGRQLDLFS